MATTTSLSGTHRGGQTFVTFTKNSGSSAGTTYKVWRKATQITSLAGLTEIATLDADSWHLLYDDASVPAPQLSSGFIISDLGTPLASTQGLLVWTTAVTGNWYYAVTNSDDPTTITVGTNSLTSPVAETYQAVPGAVRIGTVTTGTATHYKYYAWEDYASWKTTQWGYYGFRFNASLPFSGSNFPLVLELHAAGPGYAEPAETGGNPNAVVISPRDLSFTGHSDPYATANPAYPHSLWFGRYDSVSDRIYAITETRVVRYALLVRDNATGDGVNYHIDAQRLVVEGSSLGSGAMHVASHYPGLFAAAAVAIGYCDADGYTGGGGLPVGQSSATVIAGSPGNGLTWGHWGSITWLAENGYPIPPTTHMFNKDDGTVTPVNYPAALTALEAASLPFAAQWGLPPGGPYGHSAQNIDTGAATLFSGHRWDIARFLLNESYPAFGTSSNSDAVGTAPLTSSDPTFFGNRNVYLDWQSSLHTFAGGLAISESSTTYAISLKSTSGTATGVTVTIRNAQSFLPSVGATITWSTDNGQSGSATRNSNGTVTVTGLSIPTSAIRLTFAAPGAPTGHFATVFAGAVR